MTQKHLMNSAAAAAAAANNHQRGSLKSIHHHTHVPRDNFHLIIRTKINLPFIAGAVLTLETTNRHKKRERAKASIL
jgi:hypothetical protein